ncbi:MAG: gliding motility protein, GldB [Flavobacteriaceae bacterium]|nr:gliding motility protein, GldB [Flavobacteriaceae bacterium]
MNVIKIWGLLCLVFLASCGRKDVDRWQIESLPTAENIDIIHVSDAYYNPEITPDELRHQFPDFFENASDSLLQARRSDSLSFALHQEVSRKFNNTQALSDSLNQIFSRLQYFYPKFTVPQVYTFTGELSYEFPVAYFSETADMVIGLDWFLGAENPIYQTMGVPDYFRTQMNPGNFKPKIVESIAKQMVHYDIRKRKFIEKMIYEGKLLIIQDALLPDMADAFKIGYTQDQINWAVTNEAQIYIYFTEEQMFFSDDKRLNQRFIDPAPFSKFFSESDIESPGRIAAWMGWQICRSYLEKNPNLTLQDFINDQDLIKIFNESGYKPMR